MTTTCVVKMKKRYQAMELGKATQPYCALLLDLHWFVTQTTVHIKPSETVGVFLIFQHWLEEYEEREKRTFSLISLQLIIIYNVSSLRTLSLFFGHSEHWVLFIWYVLLISHKNIVICKQARLVTQKLTLRLNCSWLPLSKHTNP